MANIRNWFYRIGALHGLQKKDLADLGRSAMFGHNLRQADYSDIKDYLFSIADEDKCLDMHTPLIAAEAYEAMQLKKAMEVRIVKEDNTEKKTMKHKLKLGSMGFSKSTLDCPRRHSSAWLNSSQFALWCAWQYDSRTIRRILPLGMASAEFRASNLIKTSKIGRK
ncbi:hypothetical protein F5Y05DRAFT_385727 [Hypoxylon sp. FL0543]|nr:hypothetical protein F5Y05DRAFT_385727 [Hypoxylon sp. FL0543]